MRTSLLFFALAAWSIICYVGGLWTVLYETGDLVAFRDSGACIALDTANGQALGHFEMRNNRCYIADWRWWHPLTQHASGWTWTRFSVNELKKP